MNPAFLEISLNIDNNTKKCDTLTQTLKKLIADGRIRVGEKLPSSRSLAEELSVSRTTTKIVLENLVSEGYAETRHGSGTYVIANPLGQDFKTPSIAPLDAQPDRFKPERRTFTVGMPETRTFPYRIWSKTYSSVWSDPNKELFDAQDPFGWWSLRLSICKHLEVWRGLQCSPEQVVITSGMAGTMEVLSRVVFSQSAKIAVEDPCNPRVLKELRSRGLSCVPCPINDDGMDFEFIKRHHRGLSGIFLTPSSQHPLGVKLSSQRRKELVDWAKDTDTVLLEDDYDSEFIYSGFQQPSLASSDHYEKVIYLGSFSKTIFPHLRIGFILLPKSYIDRARSELSTKWRPASIMMQPVLSEFMDQGHFAKHLRRMRVTYARRQDALIEAIKNTASDVLHAHHASSGTHITANIINGFTDQVAAQRCAELGVVVNPLGFYYFDIRETKKIVLGFAAFDETELEHGVERLSRALR